MGLLYRACVAYIVSMDAERAMFDRCGYQWGYSIFVL